MRLSTLTGPLYGSLSLTLCAAVVGAVPLVIAGMAFVCRINSSRPPELI
jgi:hypothetical protein